ncbi:MAG: ATP-dependent Clp protease ATP-binding subunit, partial [Chloroflexi bacterium]|nr:ATP-dependent Clp protease ATP-binding subunit [Chloroflexota bacterium]
MVLRPENFTEQAQQALGTSQEIVRRYRHTQWDSEHILMALLEQDKGVPIDILTEMGVSVDAIKARLNEILNQAPKVAVQANQIFVTPRVEALLSRAKAEADRLGDDFISTEHLLIGLTQDGQGGVAQVFKEHQIDTERV